MHILAHFLHVIIFQGYHRNGNSRKESAPVAPTSHFNDAQNRNSFLQIKSISPINNINNNFIIDELEIQLNKKPQKLPPKPPFLKAKPPINIHQSNKPPLRHTVRC